MAHKYSECKKEILKIPGVLNMTASNATPCTYDRLMPLAYYHEDAVVSAHTLFVDPSFMDTYGIVLKDGKKFSTRWEEMPGFVIINEGAAKVLQSAGSDPLYRAISIPYVKRFWQHRLQGIMQDFKSCLPSKHSHPLALLPSSHLQYSRNIMTIRLGEQDQIDSLAKIEKTINRFYPNAMFDYRYLSDEIDHKNAIIMERRRLALVFIAEMWVCITIFGLLGFAVYETKKCSREMGIRKVLGAGSMQIFRHFTGRYIRRALVANGIAWLFVGLGGQHLLRIMGYTHLVQFNFFHYFWAGFFTLGLTLVIPMGLIYRAALVNPAEVLRNEKLELTDKNWVDISRILP